MSYVTFSGKSYPQDPSDPRASPVQRLIRAYREFLGQPGEPLSFERFAAGISRPVGLEIPGHVVQTWETGRNLPSIQVMMRLLRHMPWNTWQYTFAHDLAAALWPESFYPISSLGRKALDWY